MENATDVILTGCSGVLAHNYTQCSYNAAVCTSVNINYQNGALVFSKHANKKNETAILCMCIIIMPLAD